MKYCIIALLALASCTQARKETPAVIIERKMLPDSQLMLLYTYTVNNTQYTDSAVVKNRVIPHDSVVVEYAVDTPGKNLLKFE